MNVMYPKEPGLSVTEFADVLKRSTLAERQQMAEEFVAEGDRVVARLTYTGTHAG